MNGIEFKFINENLGKISPLKWKWTNLKFEKSEQFKEKNVKLKTRTTDAIY